MKRVAKKIQRHSVWATLVFFIFASSSMAADFFPLDIWEALTASEPENAAARGPDAEAFSVTTQRDMDTIEMAQMHFPFDVQKELNDLGERDSGMQSTHRPKNSATNSDTANPFGVPDELLMAASGIGG